MRQSASRLPLEELKVRAHILIKSLRGNGASEPLAAAERLQRLPRFSALSPAQIVASRADVQLKHALSVVALEHGYASWEAAKKALDVPQGPPRTPADETGERLYPQRCSGALNQWFVSYDEARATHDEAGGFLLPYRNQFFICESGHIENLGLSPDDPDWERIGWDWARPKDLDAWARLSAKLG